MDAIGTVMMDAHQFAAEAHKGQKDKAGWSYISHPERVATNVSLAGGTVAQIEAAYLHDVVEDTDVTMDDLREHFQADTVEIVDALTKRKGEKNADYYERIKETPPALLVKFCDIHDNLMPCRLIMLDDVTRVRLAQKYGAALIALSTIRAGE